MNQELIQYYIDLLIIQYLTKPNATGTIRALIEALMIFDLIRQVDDGFDIDTAVGAQLDILAKYHGTQRAVSAGSETGSFFGSIRAATPVPTESVTGSVRNTVATLPPFQQLTYESNINIAVQLNDDDLRTLIRAKRFVNTEIHSADLTFRFLQEFFPGQNIFSDNQNMTITYIFSEAVRRLADIFESEEALPRPAGVGLNMSFLPQLDAIFSMISYNIVTIPPYAAGYIRYGDPPSGGWLRYE